MYECPQQNVAKKRTEISVKLCQSRKTNSTSNTVNGADLRGGDKKGCSKSVHLPSMYFKATDVTINREKRLKVIKHFQISQ
jgi:hypothetical protein